MRRHYSLMLLSGLLLSMAVQAREEPEQRAQRVVSAGGSVTEWLVTLGAEERLVGVDSTSRHPARLTRLPDIGYQRQLAAEGILALSPQVLIGTEEMGPPPIIAQLEKSGVHIVRLSNAASEQAVHDNLLRLGQLLATPQRARAAAELFRQKLEDQKRWLVQAQRTASPPQVLMLISHAGSAAMIAGSGTVGDWMIDKAGGKNLARHTGFLTLSDEAILALDPDILIITDRTLEGAEARDALLRQRPALASTRAGRDGRLLTIDPTLLVGGLGPRIPAELSALSRAFYPAAEPLSLTADSRP